MREIEARLQERNARILGRAFVGKPWREALAGPVDAVIVNGEGTIHHTATSERARELVRVGAFARRELGVPVFLINATLHAIAEPELEGLRHFDAIYTRDSASRDEIARAGIAATVVPDLTIAARLPVSAGPRAGVCGTDSVISADARALRRLCSARGWSYWPMTYRFRGSPKRWPKLDAWFPAFARAAFGIGDPVAAFTDFVLAHRLLVTGRYHAVTYCIATETPFVAVDSNTPKTTSLVQDVFGDSKRVVPASLITGLDVESAAAWTDSERLALRSFKAEAQTATEAMFDRLVGPRVASQAAPR